METIDVKKDYIKVKEARCTRFPDVLTMKTYFNRAIFKTIVDYENECNLNVGYSIFKKYISLIYGIDYRLFFMLKGKKYTKNDFHMLVRDTIIARYKTFKAFSEQTEFPYKKILKNITLSAIGRDNNGLLQHYLDLAEVLNLGELSICIGKIDTTRAGFTINKPFRLNSKGPIRTRSMFYSGKIAGGSHDLT